MHWDYHPSEIQANILKGHGRDHACFLFFQFDQKVGQSFLRKEIARFAAEEITSFDEQCKSALKNRTAGMGDDFVVSLFLSQKGLEDMGVEKKLNLSDPAFCRGMDHECSAKELGDYFNGDGEQKIYEASGMVLIAHSNLERLQDRVECLKTTYFNPMVVQNAFYFQWAQTLRDDKRRPMEHFGYADGFSTPRDESELAGMGLVQEQGMNRYGSYVAFRKIEQHIRHFERMVKDLSACLGKPREYAMALLMGRFPNGTPLTLSDIELPEEEWKDIPFDYAEDDGSRCPVHAHIRVVHPRREGSSKPRIIRRSMTYADPDGKHGKGLCFLSYQRSLVDDFIPLFQRISSNPQDALVYRTRNLIWKYKDEDVRKRKFYAPYAKEYGSWLQGAVCQLIGGRELTTFRGGQYFYAPSKPFLTDLEKLDAPE